MTLNPITYDEDDIWFYYDKLRGVSHEAHYPDWRNVRVNRYKLMRRIQRRYSRWSRWVT